ncbi:MAG TPA: preprotein translocase subunit SecE [Microlunatus sp.]
MADGDKVDPADEPDTSATPGEPEDPALGVDDGEGVEPDREPTSQDDDRELVTAGLASRAKAGESDATTGSGPAKKDKATPKQKRDAVEHKRTGPVTLVRQSVAELRKVVYPTGPQLANYFVVVLIFVLFIIAYVSLLDLGIGAAVFRIFA